MLLFVRLQSLIRTYFHQGIMATNKRRALLLSSSNCHGYSMLEFAHCEIDIFFKSNNITDLLFVPYAQNDYDGYTSKIKSVIENWGYKVTGIHSYSDPTDAIKTAKAVFVGGGNTFLLLKRLYENNLVDLIKHRVFNDGLLYVGSSAGTNVATRSIHTTNDMPITFPPTFEAIGIIPFNINPHYLEIPETGTHKGETREQRICEFLEMPHARPVLGLKEGAMLYVEGNSAIVKGVAGAVLFSPGQPKKEIEVGADLSHLLYEP